MQSARRVRRTLLALTALLALVLALGACGGSGDSEQQGEIEITCASCSPNPADSSEQYAYETTQLFNRKYAGRYHVKIIRNGYSASGGVDERVQHLQRLALADDLPDLFVITPNELRSLERTGKLMNFKPALDADADWKASFHDGVFDAISSGDRVWGIPQTRDAIGIFYNRAIFREAGVAAYPRTWAEVDAACEKIAAIGKKCFAMDGNWTTLLTWGNLLGTQPEGKAFLDGGIREGDYSQIPAVVRATEKLKEWHTKGFTNADAFSGEYQNAATSFIRGQAAMIANGPWMVNTDIRTKNAIKGLYGEVGYENAPGWTADQQGVVLLAAEGSVGSGASDPRKQEAVVAWVKFFDSHERMLRQITFQGAYPATKFTPQPGDDREIEPLGAALIDKAGSVPMTYPTPYTNSPAQFSSVWTNLWPAYVRDKMSTQEFLSKLADDVQSVTG